jgi:succinyl-CoA synthetase beta subunit
MVKFYEWKAKEIFSRHAIPVPQGYVVSSPEEVRDSPYPAAAKAQVLAGGRGKAGGVRFVADPEEARRVVGEILGMEIGGYRVRQVLLEERLDIAQELYLAFLIDRTRRTPLLMASRSGGVEIEAVPDREILRINLPPFLGLQPYAFRELRRSLGLSGEVGEKIAAVANKAYEAFVAEDAELLEINPLVLTRAGEVVAGDAKLVVDDNALYRHPEFKDLDQDLTPLEMEAREKDIAFVQLDGDIGVIANGAGLTMATLDVLNLMGGRPGIFLDLGGTDDPEKVKQCFSLMKKARPRVIFLNIFGGITKCDTVALGVKEAMEAEAIDVPVVARIKGLNEERAREILRGAGITTEGDFEAAGRAAVGDRGA